MILHTKDINNNSNQYKSMTSKNNILQVRLDDDLNEKLVECCNVEDRTKTAITIRALRMYIDGKNKE